MFKRVIVIAVLAVLLAAGVSVATGQTDPVITVDLTPYEGNPIIPRADESTWYMATFEPRVVLHDGVFHLFFSGQLVPAGSGSAIGYATSPDGLAWTPYEGNPILTTEQTGTDDIATKVVFHDGEKWVLLFNPGVKTHRDLTDHYLRATAADPTGPWEVDPEPVLEVGRAGAWDHADIVIESLVPTEDGYASYYVPLSSSLFGLAISPDGVTWTKYDDPETTGMTLGDSDPVFHLKAGKAFDQSYIDTPTVRQRTEGWEMFYSGCDGESCRVGYAYSPDGIEWTRHPENPVFSLESTSAFPQSVVVVNDNYYLYYNEFGEDFSQIGVATGAVTWE